MNNQELIEKLDSFIDKERGTICYNCGHLFCVTCFLPFKTMIIEELIPEVLKSVLPEKKDEGCKRTEQQPVEKELEYIKMLNGIVEDIKQKAEELYGVEL